MKIGIDYYPHFTAFSKEEKDFRYSYGATGMGLYYAILNDIYSLNGYYIKITKPYLKELTFSNNITDDNNKQSIELTMQMIGQMIKSKLFDITLFKKYKILTSKEIQKNYFKVAERRTATEIVEEYVMPFLNTKNENVNRTEENVNEAGKNVEEKEQSRELKKLVNNINNIFNNERVHTSVRARERTQEERQIFIDYYRWWFMPHISKEKQETVLEVIDTMIEALEQARTVNGIKFKDTTYYKSDIAKIISTINPDRLGSICLSLETKKSYNKAWYILGCIINKGIKETAIRYQNDDFLHKLIEKF